ncbi:50S ribosomal protein L9 [bioreactor metagenome]|uniref:50S ribosomal protein L9 n=1 Tax=bioreactor metagenome TaxID=1076179 RepID=A0A645AIG3_9ZZZZ|nr:50S ribosomal protein L9 [Christensenella sp.]
MKLLLEQDVKGTGKKGEIVDVSDGYARNFLLPRKLATPADAQSVNAANIQKSAAAHRKFQAGVAARELAKQLDGAVVTVKAKVGDNGHLFGAITGKEISAALKEQRQVDVDKKKIALNDPIRALGEYNIRVSIYENTFANVKVIVEKC